jgi:hypothetical protein
MAHSPISLPVSTGGSFQQLCLVDADGKTILQKRFQHTAAGLEQLQEAMTGHPARSGWASNARKGGWWKRCSRPGWRVYCVSPKISARARERYRPATKKSDAFDAFVLADTLRHAHAHWRALSTLSVLRARIRALSRDRERLVISQGNTENRLRSVMESYNPAVLHLFPAWTATYRWRASSNTPPRNRSGG